MQDSSSVTSNHYAQFNAVVEPWLNFLVTDLPGVTQVQVVLGESDCGFQPAAIWPSAAENDPAIEELIQQCITRKQPLISRYSGEQQQQAGEGAHVRAGESTHVLALNKVQSCLVAVPVFSKRQCYGVVGAHMRIPGDLPTEKILDQLQQSTKWLEFCAQYNPQDASDERIVLSAVVHSLSRNDAHEAMMALTTDLASKLNCERVSIGLNRKAAGKKPRIRIASISNTSHFAAGQALVHDLEALLEEAIDQDRTLVQPILPQEPPGGQLVHKKYSQQQGDSRLCTVPLVHDSRLTGGIVFERVHSAAAFSRDEVALCEQIAALISPVLVYRQRSERGWLQHFCRQTRQLFKKIFGAGHLTWKISLLSGFALLLFFAFARHDYRVVADASLKGRIERVISVPEDGFIKNSTVRPGDTVTTGQELAGLDDRDLLLEQQKWNSKLQQTMNEYREALASHETSRIGVLRAQQRQVQAQLDLVTSMLSRLSITSPIDGLIVSGDLTQSLGSPVSQGDVVFKVAPLAEYLVHLKVDEADVTQLRPGQRGKLFLRAAVDEPLTFSVEKITPVATPEDDINYFRVDALLDQPPLYLTPGMEGVGKIEVGRRQLIWIWTHKLTEWLKLKLWSWW